MTRPLIPIHASLLPPHSCAQGQHDGRIEHGTTTASGAWWACRRCPHRWHVNHMGQLTLRGVPR